VELVKPDCGVAGRSRESEANRGRSAMRSAQDIEAAGRKSIVGVRCCCSRASGVGVGAPVALSDTVTVAVPTSP